MLQRRWWRNAIICAENSFFLQIKCQCLPKQLERTNNETHSTRRSNVSSKPTIFFSLLRPTSLLAIVYVFLTMMMMTRRRIIEVWWTSINLFLLVFTQCDPKANKYYERKRDILFLLWTKPSHTTLSQKNLPANHYPFRANILEENFSPNLARKLYCVFCNVNTFCILLIQKKI